MGRYSGMGEGKPFEPVRKIRPGDEVIRKRVKPRRRLRVGPRVPEAIRSVSYTHLTLPTSDLV